MFTQIRTRIVVYFVAIAVFVSVLFSLLGLLYSYYVEDEMFHQVLTEESVRVQQQIMRGEQPKPQVAYVQFYADRNDLPEEVLRVLIDEPDRVEFSGTDGKHYHLMHIEQGYILAEVSDYLIVRRIKIGMLYTQSIFSLMIAILTALIAWLMAKQLIRPIDQLNTVLLNVQGRQLPIGFSSQFSNDEIGRFAKELDKVMSRVQNFIKREQDFTRDVSHELKTPITISQGAVSLLKDTALNEEQMQLATRLEDAQKQMQQCIEGLLSLAREERLQQEQVLILPLIESVVVEHYHLLSDDPKSKAIELHLDVSADAQTTTNAEEFRIILSNIIANAFVHTDKGKISIRYTDNCLSITNTGSKIDPAMLPDIFLSGIKSEQSSGYGIGLSLVKRLCLRLDIEIEINSDREGTTVTMEPRPNTHNLSN
ncbi:sensor histidine kinase [Microbulbifer sp. 2304DJ12-6]|uniref:sensor histidine kinase n=1 Tax=Microbulbifer sp. 2304DJ12-6 TaxID=3233340 RepID=UPI0039AFC277